MTWDARSGPDWFRVVGSKVARKGWGHGKAIELLFLLECGRAVGLRSKPSCAHLCKFWWTGKGKHAGRQTTTAAVDVCIVICTLVSHLAGSAFAMVNVTQYPLGNWGRENSSSRREDFDESRLTWDETH